MNKLSVCWIVAAATIGLMVTLAEATTAAAAPLPFLQCRAGSYQASSGDCVEDPDQNTNNVTAICADGSDSHSEHHSGTCSGHGGVAQWCPCGGTSPASDSSPDSDGPDPDTYLFGLQQQGVTLTRGTDAAIAMGFDICQAARSGMGADAIAQSEMNDPTNSLTLPEAADIEALALEELCPDTDPSVWADATRLAGHSLPGPN